MVRHTCFRFCLDPTVEQATVLDRYAGAARFAYNQCLATVKSALTARDSDPDVEVPWSGFDLINYINAWKKSEAAGRMFTVDAGGVAAVTVTGLAWRSEVCQQVFEEAAVDCGRALAGWSASRSGIRHGRRVGFPQFKKKTDVTQRFRIRSKQSARGRSTIRVGDDGITRSITLPVLGTIRVREDTRRLRRMLAGGRAKILFATITRRAGRWHVSVNVEAADLHSDRRHPPRSPQDCAGWVGVDRGLSVFLVAATCGGRELDRVTDAPRALAAGLRRQRRLAKAVTRKRKGSNNRRRATARVARHHTRVAARRRHFLHEVSARLVKTHDRLVLEDLNTAGMLANRHLARAISDAGWGQFARLVGYKQQWRGGQVLLADRWFPSTRTCSGCGNVNRALTLADRVFACECGHSLDRDLNAAINLAAWGEKHYRAQVREPEARAPVINVRRRDGAGPHSGVGGTVPDDAETDTHTTSVTMG
ncbi:RNA-guided endonuclease TnpB family protein [Nocardia vinacea]|uniref:RNA-guided endonuclease TnpB family protein n=1 Tax=Nocardia vinacea TaxID=96468 RepID=UPI0034225E2A